MRYTKRLADRRLCTRRVPHTPGPWVVGLIAAAPDLYEALRELLAALENSARADAGRDDVAAMLRYAAAEKAARAALAKVQS